MQGGTIVPADVKWINGDSMKIDTAALTGEPIPRKYPSDEHGDEILSGTTVVAGECYCQALKTGSNTEIGQAQASVLQDKSVRVVSVFQKKIMTVIQILVSASFAVVIAVLLVEGLAYNLFYEGHNNIYKAILDAIAIMIASIPVALPLVLQINLALGANFLATEHSAIVTSIPALQDIASMSMLCSDKTGTLTTANMSIIMDELFAGPDFTSDDVISYAFFSSNPDKQDDPIDRAVTRAYNDSDAKQNEGDFKQKELMGFNNDVKRVVAFVEYKGKMITVAKGLPDKCIDTTSGGKDDHEIQWRVKEADDKEFMDKVNKRNQELSESGYKTIAVAVCKENAREAKNPEWHFVGLLPMLDPPRKFVRR